MAESNPEVEAPTNEFEMKCITSLQATFAITQTNAPFSTPSGKPGAFHHRHINLRTYRSSNALSTRTRCTARNNQRRSTICFSTNENDEDDQLGTSENFEKYNKPTKKRQRKRDPIMDSITKDKNVPLTLVESSTAFLFRRISLPSILPMIPGDKRSTETPLIYILSVATSVTILPVTTWILLTGFFGLYLSLGTVFMDENEDIDNNFDNDEERDQYNEIVPLAAFTGAIASAGLLSPQGLISTAPFSLASPVAVIALALGGIAVLMGISDNRDDELRFGEKDKQERRVREEKRQMHMWDDEIKKSAMKRKRSDEE